MIWKNIEVHNIAEWVPTEAGVTWRRVPRDVYSVMEKGGDTAKNSTGVELRFVIRSEQEATVVLRSLGTEDSVPTLQVYRGGLQGGWADHEINRLVRLEPTRIRIARSPDIAHLRRCAAAAEDEWDPEVVRVIFDRGEYELLDVEGDVAPPRPEQVPRRVLLAYGSSITHGSNSICASGAWVSQVARRLGTDARNLGMAGSCAMEDAFARYLAEEGVRGAWDVATLELGINVLDWEPQKMRRRASDFIRRIGEANPEKPVFVISPFYSREDFNGGTRARLWRDTLADVVTQAGLANVRYLDGTDLLGDMRYISADGVHPNTDGMQKIADGLAPLLCEALGQHRLLR